jgi:hypothetical protein
VETQLQLIIIIIIIIIINNKYYYANQIKENEVGGICGTHGRGEECVQAFVGKEGKIPLLRPRRRWEDGIRMDLREIGWGSVDWIQLVQDRDRWRALVNTVMNLRVLAPRS